MSTHVIIVYACCVRRNFSLSTAGSFGARRSSARTDLIAARGETWELRMVNNRAIQSAPSRRSRRAERRRKEERRKNVTLSARRNAPFRKRWKRAPGSRDIDRERGRG